MLETMKPLSLAEILNHSAAWRLAATLKPEVKRIDPETFYVRGRTAEYLVKLSLEGGQCNCMAGQNGRVCYHLTAAITNAAAKEKRTKYSPRTGDSMSGYLIVDAENTLVGETPFPTERKAYEAKRVYEDNCSDIVRPLRIVRADSVVRAEVKSETGTWTVTEFPERHPQQKSLSEAESERENNYHIDGRNL